MIVKDAVVQIGGEVPWLPLTQRYQWNILQYYSLREVSGRQWRWWERFLRSGDDWRTTHLLWTPTWNHTHTITLDHAHYPKPHPPHVPLGRGLVRSPWWEGLQMVFVAEENTSLDGGMEEISSCPVALSTCLHLQLCVCEGGAYTEREGLANKTNNKLHTTNAVFFNCLFLAHHVNRLNSFRKSCFYTISFLQNF